MKKFIISIILFFILTGLIITHSVIMLNFGKEARALSDTIKTSAQADKWEKVESDMKKFEKLWEEKRFWASITLKTPLIEEIDISMEQSVVYARNKAKPDFLGEFIMLKQLIEHIPHQEGFHIEEIL